MEYNEALRIKKGIYTICFVLMCLIDQIRGSATGRAQFVATNCFGILIAVIILSAYELKDFLKPPYYLWVVSFMIGYYISIPYARENYPYFWKWITAGINVGIYGLIVLRILYRILTENWRPRMRRPYFVLWIVMMVCMVISRNDSTWPLWFCVMFGSLYLSDFTSEEKDAVCDSMMNGIIIGFCILQGFATLYRAYDTVRYTGMYTNSNMNALFYMMVQLAILGKWYKFVQTKALFFWRAMAAIGSGIMLTYCFLTIGRLALGIMIINVFVLAFLLLKIDQEKKLIRYVKRVFFVFLVSVLSFPLVFNSVRWIPAYVNTPMTMEGDGPDKIREWTRGDDERYVEKDELLEEALGRIMKLFFSSTTENIMDIVMPSIKAYAMEDPDSIVTDNIVKPGDTPETALLENGDTTNSFQYRQQIYKTYISRFNLLGHTAGENTGVWVTPRYHAPHAHDVFIQFSFDFGIIVGLLFLFDAVLVLFFLWKKSTQKDGGDWKYVVCFLSVFSFIMFGLFENNWTVATLPFTMFFMAHYPVLHNCSNHLDPSGKKSRNEEKNTN